MAPFRTAALAAILLLQQSANAFLPRTTNNNLASSTTCAITTTRSAVLVQHMSSSSSNNNNNDDEDPTKVWYAGLANVVQNALTNSPLNEGKNALVKSLAGNYDRAAVRAKLNALVRDKPVLMLSFRTCPFCVKAKAVLDDKKARYHVVELDEIPQGKAIRAEMADVIGRTSVPAIWIGGDFIGGCNDGPKGGIVKLRDSGELDTMLRAVKAI